MASLHRVDASQLDVVGSYTLFPELTYLRVNYINDPRDDETMCLYLWELFLYIAPRALH